MNISKSLTQEAQSLLLYFPNCQPKTINENIFERLSFDRKAEGYKQAIELSRIILMNYHPDIKGGVNDNGPGNQ
jgi:5-methylcytosine-specific restriction enzyme subunit McrC